MFNKFSYVCDYGLPVSDIHSILDIIFLFAQIIYVIFHRLLILFIPFAKPIASESTTGCI